MHFPSRNLASLQRRPVCHIPVAPANSSKPYQKPDHSELQPPPNSSTSFTKTKESVAKNSKFFKQWKSLDSSSSPIDFLLTFFTKSETGTCSRPLSSILHPVTPLRRVHLLRIVCDFSSETSLLYR